ncbi:hypothetical protein D3C85_1549810 [compost metagenome]
MLPELLQHFPAVHARQHHVQDDEVVVALECVVQAVPPRGDQIDDERRLGKPFAEVLPRLGFILDDQNFHDSSPAAQRSQPNLGADDSRALLPLE